MKLFIILSVVACGFAAKLHKGYLPPASAATAGGSSDSLTAPSSGVSGLPSSPSNYANTGDQGSQSPSGPGFQSNPGFESAAQYQPSARPIRPTFGQPGYDTSSGFADFQSGVGIAQPGFGTASGLTGNQGNQVTTAYSEKYQPERARASLDSNAEILRYENQNDGETFAYSFETSNGISAEESGVATNGVQAQGAYSYTGDDGQQYRVTYTADENGYQPQGDHLPTPHPIPEEILRSIEENARAAAAGVQEGAYNPDEDSDITPQQYNIEQSSYQGSSQPSGQAGAYNQPGEAPNSQNGSPSPSFPGSTYSGSQGYQNQDTSNQKAPIASGFGPRGQAIQDQGPSPSTPTGAKAGFGSDFERQPAQVGQSGPNNGRQGQYQNQGQSGYNYNQPQEPSFGQTNQEPGQYRPQVQQSGAPLKPQSQRPVNTGIFGPTSGPSQSPSNKGFGPTQGFNAIQGNGPTFGSSGNSGPSSAESSAFSRPAAQAYNPTGPSASPSTPQGSSFSRPSTPEQGYLYGPGTGPTGAATGKSLSGQGFASSSPSGQGFPSGPTRLASNQESSPTFPSLGSRPSGSAQPSSSGPAVGSVGSSAPNAQKPFGSLQYQPSNTAQTPQSAFPRPNSPTGSPAPNAQFPFGGASQYQGNQPSDQSSQSAYSRPSASNGQGPFGSGGQYKPNQPSAFSRPDGPTAGLSSGPNAQGPFGAGRDQTTGPKSSMIQSAPFQYNRPESQSPQTQTPGQNQSGSSGFRAPGGIAQGSGPGQTFGAPRQPPSFSSEEGYKY